MTHPTTFEMPTTDRLTGLLTTAYFRHLLRDQLLPAAEASGDPFSLFLLDGDNFKAINDAHGPECGDAVLMAMARILTEALPPTALLCRYGGDEFCVALPETRLDDAFTFAEEVRRRMQAERFALWPDVRLACCVGLAASPPNSSDVELLREADQALYVAKNTGRNKVALPLADSRMITKTSHYTATQLERLALLARTVKRSEATLLREGLDDLFKKYNDRLGAPPPVEA